MAIADDMPSTRTTAFWHPFADMGAVSNAELVIERGEGVYVFDADGKRYLDGTASLWYANLGHGRADVTRAVAAQMDRLAAYQTFGDFSNPPANALAARLSALAPMDDAKVFLASGGGDAIDTAAKIARRHWIAAGAAGARAPHQPHQRLPRHARRSARRSAGSRRTRPTGARSSRTPRRWRSTRCRRSSRRSCASAPSASRRSSASR